MELYEQGIISEKDVGFPLHWGDAEAVLRLLEMMAYRQGFGDVLAEGEIRAGQIIGRGAEDYGHEGRGTARTPALRGRPRLGAIYFDPRGGSPAQQPSRRARHEPRGCEKAFWLQRLRGWDVETGIPTSEKLRELGLEDVATDLQKRKIQ